MRKYHKIPNIFKRDYDTKKLIEGDFADKTVEYLQNLTWTFTEKIHGTNIRVGWDGHNVEIKGRNEHSNIPTKLYERLYDLFKGEDNEELFEQRFGEQPITLYGEGYGAKIQKGTGGYLEGEDRDVDFILFDVQIGDKFLDRLQVGKIASYFGIERVPIVCTGTIKDGVEYVKTHGRSTLNPYAPTEGVVGIPNEELKNQYGERIVVKIKRRDYDVGG